MRNATIGLLTLLLFSACGAESGSEQTPIMQDVADVVFVNADVYTVDEANPAAEAVLAARAGLRNGAPYLCDPVLGDAGRVYVKDGVLAAMRERLVPAADAVTPNRFELSLLTDRPTDTLEDILDALTVLRATGPKLAVCTSAVSDDDRLLTVLADDDGYRAVSVPRHEQAPYGTGDLLAALLLSGLVAGVDPAEALRHASDILYAVIADSVAAASPELTLVASRARFSDPVPQVARIVPVPA